ncbi:D-alanyl-D-alanine carboxypeptidase family protein [Hydrogenophaga aquatica]
MVSTAAWSAQPEPSKKRVAEQRSKAVKKTAVAQSAKRPKKAVVVARKTSKAKTQAQVAVKRTYKTDKASLVPTAARSVPAATPESFGEQLGLRHSDDPLNLSSTVAFVMDQHTNEVLLRKNDTAVLPIASLTKLMTGLLIAESHLPMDETIVITSDDVDRLKNSGSRLVVGARLTREEALHLALMSSENRAAHALGRTYPGGVEHFVRMMNDKAAQLGMRDTRFVDPTGLSSSNQSSARDLAVLVAAAYERPMLRDLSTSPSYEVALDGRRVLQYRNSNRLVASGNWDIGLQKTGYIREAGRCLVMQVSVAGRQLIMVLLDAAGPAARVGDAERLRRWVESSFGGGATVSGHAGKGI